MSELSSSAGRPEHEWDAMYGGAPAPWDIGRPQPVFIALADSGRITGRVLDAGCGSGEHTLMVAERGLDATGVDVASTAIVIAQRKAEDRNLSARFIAMDALKLTELGEQFDTVLDSGLFHCFDDEQRVQYVEALRAVTTPGSRLLLCCFSNEQPGDWGPRRIHQEDLRTAFANGWKIESIEAARFDVNLDPPTALAWLMTATRV